MKIAELLYRDVSQRIEPVVKVYDRESLAQDLEQFVITDSLAKELRKFLDAFAESLETRVRGGRPGDGIGAWIYGFFGSGKSHVAKVLGHILANEVVRHGPDRTAIDLFREHLDDPTLPAAKELKALLEQVRNSLWCLLIPFEIKSRQDQANPDSVTEACLRSFYRALGLAETPWLARLERKLQTEGKYEQLCAAYRDQNEHEWAEDRKQHGYYLAEFRQALCVALSRPEAEVAEMLTTYQRDHSKVTPEKLAVEICQFLDDQKVAVNPRLPHVVFVIDEMGQFIGDSENRIHELQSIIEQAGVIGRGRIWFLCTSQEALEQVVDRTGLRLTQLGKLDARFSVKIPLTGEDVCRVVQNRLLRKRETQSKVLDSLYQRYEGQIADLCALPIERQLAVVDQRTFAATYPFLPLTVPLVQDLFNAMRGFKLSGTERSLIGVAQGALRALADEPVGRVVTLDLVFDQQVEELSTADYLGTAGMKLLREIDRQLPAAPIKPSRVLKALWLISKKTDWIPRTPETLAKLLADDLAGDTAKLRMQIGGCLAALQRAGMVSRDESTGQYRYLSEEERTLEEEIGEEIERCGIGAAKRRATQLLREHVLTRSALSDFCLHLGKTRTPIPYALELDGETMQSGGELRVAIRSPLSRADAGDLRRDNIAQGPRGKTLAWNAGEDAQLLDALKRLEALEKVPQKLRWRTDRSDQTQSILRDKEKERDGLQRFVIEHLRSAIASGTVFYAGEETQLDGGSSLSQFVEDFLGDIAAHQYTHFVAADVAYDEANTAHYLTTDRTQLQRLDPELGLFDANGDLVRRHPVVEAVFEELQRRQDEDEPQDGKSLALHFSRIPFGWPESLIRLALSAMIRGGSISLQPGDADRSLTDPLDARVSSTFKKTADFRKARFRALVGGLTPAEVNACKQKLIALGQKKPAEAPHQLDDQVRRVGSSLIERSRQATQRIRDLKLPLPDLDSAPVQEALDLGDPAERVRRFIQDAEAWKTLDGLLARLDEFLESGKEREFSSHSDAATIARELPGGSLGSSADAAEALGEFDAIVEQRALLEKWKPLCEAARKIEARLETLYREKYSACLAGVRSLQKEVTSLATAKKLKPKVREAVTAPYLQTGGPLALLPLPEGVLAPAELVRAYRRTSLVQMDALLKALPRYRSEITAALEEAAAAASGTKSRPVQHVCLRERLIGRSFRDKKTFEQEWRTIGAEIAAKLDEGSDVVIDE